MCFEVMGVDRELSRGKGVVCASQPARSISARLAESKRGLRATYGMA